MATQKPPAICPYGWLNEWLAGYSPLVEADTDPDNNRSEIAWDRYFTA
jgi:hypothetical protein